MRIAPGFLLSGLALLMCASCTDSPTTPAPSYLNGGTTGAFIPGPGWASPVDPDFGKVWFSATMNGMRAVPAVQSQAGGAASFGLRDDSSAITYSVTVTNIANVTDARIYAGGSDAVGTAVVDLAVLTRPGMVNGLLAQGIITAKDLKGSLAGQSIQALKELMSDGHAFISVGTAAFPSGEIRGQVTHASIGG